MATLIAYQDGDWTGATTWKAIATGTGANQTSWQNNQTIPQQGTPSYSGTFTITNGEVIEGVLLPLAKANASSTGTVTVTLSDDNGVTATRQVTINIADLPIYTNGLEFCFIKFGTTLTADGGNDYRLGLNVSAVNNAYCMRDGTTSNWGRIFRTSTTATAAATDVLYIADEQTGQGTKNDITVTMNETANTAYGNVWIGLGGVVSYGTSASTNYYLRLSGNLNVVSGGTLNIGTSGSRIPSTSTAVLEFNCGSNVQYGLEVRDGGTCNIYGAQKGSTKVLLTSDCNSGQAVVNVQDTTGWVVGDEIAVASTTRTASQSEKRTISTVDSGTSATVSSNFTNTHQGTAPYQGEVINLTRNVKIRGMSASLQSYVNCAATSSFTADNAEFYWLGSATGSKRGIDSATTSAGTFTVRDCSIHDNTVTSSLGINTTGASGSPTISDNVVFAVNNTNLNINVTSGVPVITNNWVLNNNTNAITFNLSDVGGTITGNRAVGGLNALQLGENAAVGTFSDNVAHSASQFGISIVLTGTTGIISQCVAWRNGSAGFLVQSPMSLESCSSYHNATVNLSFNNLIDCVDCSFNGGTGQSLAATSRHIDIGGLFSRFQNCTFGATNQASSLSTVGRGVSSVLINCTVAESTIISSGQTNLVSPTSTPTIAFDKFNQTSGSHRAYKAYGYTASDQSIFRTQAPSEALLPNNASNKLPSGSRKFGVANGRKAKVSVWVRKTATYNGNQPRLMLKRNIIGGVSADTVLATLVGGTAEWLLLSGETPVVTDNCVLEVYVDCDGTAGSVNIDDWNVS